MDESIKSKWPISFRTLGSHFSDMGQFKSYNPLLIDLQDGGFNRSFDPYPFDQHFNFKS